MNFTHHDGAKLFTVRIRRDIGRDVRPEAEQLDGKYFKFRYASKMEQGEAAVMPDDPAYPKDAPRWISMGDLIP